MMRLVILACAIIHHLPSHVYLSVSAFNSFYHLMLDAGFRFVFLFFFTFYLFIFLNYYFLDTSMY